MSAKHLLDAIAVTAELTGTQLSAIAQAAMAEELLKCNVEAVIVALERCRLEVRNGGFTLGAVVERIDDGRPGADEAWAIALDAQDEACTVVWCGEIQQAFAVARPVLQAGDKVGARMAFRNAYERLVRDARMQRRPAQWSPSLGWDQGQRLAVLTRAVETGVLASQTVAGLLPAPAAAGPVMRLLLGAPSAPGNEQALSAGEAAEVARRCGEIKANLAKAKADSARRRQHEAEQQRADLAQRKARAAEAVAAGLSGSAA